jgi:NADP-dependent 3-hydroxy acid dehydrogenase YdfG
LRKITLITGASRGIGAATAKIFANAGWNLQLIARTGAELEAVATDCRSAQVDVSTACIDLSDPLQIAPAVNQLINDGGTPSVVINNAGAALTAPIGDTKLETWQWLLQLNLTSVFQLCNALLPNLRAQGGGLIINISSHAARKAFAGWGAYCTTKAALAAYSRCLAEEEAARGIRVSTLTLGSVNTPLWDSPTVRANFDRDAMLCPKRVAETLLYMAQTPAQLLLEDLTLMPSGGTF